MERPIFNRRGAPLKPHNAKALELHNQGFCVREISKQTGVRPKRVRAFLSQQGKLPHPDPQGIGNASVKAFINRREQETASTRRADALVLSGEIDRRVIAYPLIEAGMPLAQVAKITGGTLEEVERFAKEKPKNWTGMA